MTDLISDYNLSDCLALLFCLLPSPLHYFSAPDQVGGSRSRSVMWWTTLVSIFQDGEGLVLRASEAKRCTVPPSHKLR